MARGLWQSCRRFGVSGLAVLSVSIGLASAPAMGDEHIDRANAEFAKVSRDKRSDLVLLPALAALTSPPGAVDTALKAALLPAGASAWAEAAAWADAPTQRAALEALDKVTTDDNSGLFWEFAQPYGIEGIEMAAIQSGLYTELGDPPTLAAARIGYMKSMDALVCLVHVEATKRASAGDVAGAVDVLVDLVYLGRQMADRGFFRESDWGLVAMIDGFRRLRDVVYQDFRSGKPVMTAETVKELIDHLDNRAGFLRIDRIRFPRADRFAGDQLISMVMTERGGPNEAFAGTMARLAAGTRPLRLFSEVAKWDQVAGAHADWFDTTARMKNTHDDWAARWALVPFDPRLKETYEFTKLDARRDAIVMAVLDGRTPNLFADREMLRTELVGTRTSLAVLGMFYKSRSFPPLVSSVRPTFLATLEADPYNPDRANGRMPPMEFFVPIRDTRGQFGPREDPRPHVINVVVLDGNNFDVGIGDDQFILYSVGPDGAKNWARNVREDARVLFPGDYLIWPPTVSLYRQHQVESGRLN